jgi:hypothetical protein
MKILIFLMIFSTNIWAHPVIYKDGWMISSSNMEMMSDNQVMYSFSPKLATGLNHWRLSSNDEQFEFALMKVNGLLYRYNGDSSQANIYWHTGIGSLQSETTDTKNRDTYMAGVEMDWETRTLYAAIKYYNLTNPSIRDIGMTQLRLGFSPFEADFDKLQNWFMLQMVAMPTIEPKVVITPMFRFFYHNVLWEFGSSTQGNWMLNLMVHY